MSNNKKLKIFDNSIVSKRRITVVLIALVWLSFLSCNSDENVTKPDPDPPPQYETGKNYYTTEVEGVTREYYVHVPANYNPNNPTPVVFMLHGATGNGLGTYNNSGWKELGETENIITVFPTALVYCYTNSFGVTKTATRWNSSTHPWLIFALGNHLKMMSNSCSKWLQNCINSLMWIRVEFIWSVFPVERKWLSGLLLK